MQTFFHELGHALNFWLDYEEGKDAEHKIEQYTKAIQAFLVDNIALARRILDELDKA